MPAGKRTMEEVRQAAKERKVAQVQAAAEMRLEKRTNGHGAIIPTTPQVSSKFPPVPLTENERRNGWDETSLSAYLLGCCAGDPPSFVNEILGRYRHNEVIAKAKLAEYELHHDLVNLAERRRRDEIRAELTHIEVQIGKCLDLLAGA
jgi:hypothetical protein